VPTLKRDDALDATIERADQAMYQAKTQGRCRCVLLQRSDAAAALA
jgi:PleD family two-component response regulator